MWLASWTGSAVHPSPRWISPAYLPSGLSDFPEMNFIRRLAFRLQLAGLSDRHAAHGDPGRGIRESAETNNVMVLLKVVAIIVFVGFGAGFIHPANWHPFARTAWPGILTGGSIIFFTYNRFDSVSTAARKPRIPRRDLPIGIIATLVICTILLHLGGGGPHRPGSLANVG